MPRSQELTEVREAHRIDAAALDRYLGAHLEGYEGPLVVEQFEGGQSNPTYRLTDARQKYVLRKKPPGTLLPTAHMVEREYRVISALADSDVPVPRALLLCEDEGVIGTTFFVMEFLPGRVFWDPTLPEQTPGERRAIYDAMNDVLAKLHLVDYRAVGLETYGKPGNYFARQIKRWSSQYVAAKTEDFPEMDRLMAWLPENVPDDDTTTIVHGDYRLDNMIFHPEEPRVIALLDWELSTLGHPLADLAYNCMPYHAVRAGTPGLSSVGDGVRGIPTEAEYVEAYCRRIGRESIPRFEFYLAFSLFRLAAITQGVYQRALLGNASSARAKDAIVTARISGKTAWEIAQKAG